MTPRLIHPGSFEFDTCLKRLVCQCFYYIDGRSFMC